MSTRSVRCPRRARQAARLILVVVFPQPPFWLMIAMVRMRAFLGLGAKSPIGRSFDRYSFPTHPPTFTSHIGGARQKTLGLSLIHISEPTRQAEISYAV